LDLIKFDLKIILNFPQLFDFDISQGIIIAIVSGGSKIIENLRKEVKL